MKKKSFILVVFLLLGLFFLSACQGEVGEAGLKGPTGDQGEQGEKGETGDKGATGAKGATGDKGADAAAVVLDITSDGIVWQNEGDESWQPVISFDDLFAYRHTYTITLDANGGTIEQSEIKNCIYKEDAIIEFTPSYAMEGVENEWTFMGWKDAKDGTIYEDGGVVNVLRDYTLVAQWEAEVILGGVEEAQGAPRVEYLNADGTEKSVEDIVGLIKDKFLDEFSALEGYNQVQKDFIKRFTVENSYNWVRNAVEADKTFKFGFYQAKNDKVVYATGAMKGYYGASTENAAEAADFKAEAVVGVEGAYNLKLTLADGTTVKYLNVSVSGDHTNLTFDDAATTNWTFDANLLTFVAEANGHTTADKDGLYFVGTYNTYDTLSMNKVSDVTGENASAYGVSKFPAVMLMENELYHMLRDELGALGGLLFNADFSTTDFADEWAWLFIWILKHPDSFSTAAADGSAKTRADGSINSRAQYVIYLLDGSHDDTSRDSEMTSGKIYPTKVLVNALVNFFCFSNYASGDCSIDKTISFKRDGVWYSASGDEEGEPYDPFGEDWAFIDQLKVTLEPSLSFKLGDPAYDLIEVKRDGYTFKGWYLNEEGTGDPITSVDATLNGQVVYAVWEAVAE